MTHKEISDRVQRLNAERRRYLQEVTRDFDAEQEREREYLREACGRVGHVWKFTDWNPCGDPCFSCPICGATRVGYQKNDR